MSGAVDRVHVVDARHKQPPRRRLAGLAIALDQVHHRGQLIVHTIDSLTADKMFKDLAFYDYPALVLVRRKIAIKYPTDGQLIQVDQFMHFLKEVYGTKPKIASVNRDIDSLSSSVRVR